MTSRSPLLPSRLADPLAADPEGPPVRACPPGTRSLTGGPPRVGTSISAPRAASLKVTGHGQGQVVALATEHRVRADVHHDVEVAGGAAVLAGTALALQPDPLAVRDARPGSGPAWSWSTSPRPEPWQTGQGSSTTMPRPRQSRHGSVIANTPPDVRGLHPACPHRWGTPAGRCRPSRRCRGTPRRLRR